MNKIRHLEIILKVSERCNINCTYCYVFNLGNELAVNSKPVIATSTIEDLRRFLENAAITHDIDTLVIDFHGGEPLMIGKKKFAAACKIFRAGNYGNAELHLACQSNGILIDDEWIDLFSKYHVGVGVSIDGPKHINDKHRLDRKGRSTYEGTVNGFRLLQSAYAAGRLHLEPGILSVANPSVTGAEIYRHFVDTLNCQRFDLLIPDESHASCKDPNEIADFYCSAIDEFFADGNPNIDIRYISTHIHSIIGNDHAPAIGVNKATSDVFALTVMSDGEIYLDDTLRSTNHELFSPIGNVRSLALSDVMDSWQFKKSSDIENNLPSDCTGCIWKKVCSGGSMIQRFSKEEAFQRKSVYCPSLKKIFSRIAAHLISAGIPEERISKNLEG
ncbi:XyeB family radical SAM/SPASM peptide maturase [Salmonella enterica]|nr:XyeB family radical SAM/SPASM peptide maturase [Salmonella enterica]